MEEEFHFFVRIPEFRQVIYIHVDYNKFYMLVQGGGGRFESASPGVSSHIYNIPFINSERCGHEDPVLKVCLEDVIPLVMSAKSGINTTLQETLHLITVMSQQQNIYCE